MTGFLEGNVVEFDKPYRLLVVNDNETKITNQKSMFA